MIDKKTLRISCPEYIEDLDSCIRIPQTELAMRGSYGVGKEGGYDSSADPVALPRSILYCNLHDLVAPTLKNTSLNCKINSTFAF